MLYIRVDANETIATGHVMRCLSIADAAKDLGEDTTFIMADGRADMLVKSKGYHSVILHTQWDDMDGETDKMLDIIRKNGISRLLIDSYQVTEKYLTSLSEETKVTYIDDLDKFIYPADTLICYAAYYDKFNYASKYSDTKLLLGTKYAPLRREFCGLKKKLIHDRIERILVLSGGTDRMNVLQQILDAVVSFENIHIDAICGFIARQIISYRICSPPTSPYQQEGRHFTNSVHAVRRQFRILSRTIRPTTHHGLREMA